MYSSDKTLGYTELRKNKQIEVNHIRRGVQAENLLIN